MTKPPEISPRKSPQQERSRATVDAIVEAAARILARGDDAAFTTNHVAERAGVSVGSFYQYFPNKEALLAHLLGQHAQDVAQSVRQAAIESAGGSLQDAVEAAVCGMVAAHVRDRHLPQVIARTESLGSRSKDQALAARNVAWLSAGLERYRDELAVQDTDRAAHLIIAALEAAIHQALRDNPADLESGRLAPELTRLVVRYLSKT